MTKPFTVGIENYPIEKSSDYVSSLILIYTDTKTNRNPIPKRKSMAQLPYELLEVGYSIWLNIDDLPKELIATAVRHVKEYNKKYKNIFVTVKHRGDKRKSGFKYLEIGRIK